VIKRFGAGIVGRIAYVRAVMRQLRRSRRTRTSTPCTPPGGVPETGMTDDNSRFVKTGVRQITVESIKNLTWESGCAARPGMNPTPSNGREARRRQAWDHKEKGWSQRQIAAAVGVSAGAVSQWAAVCTPPSTSRPYPRVPLPCRPRHQRTSVTVNTPRDRRPRRRHAWERGGHHPLWRRRRTAIGQPVRRHVPAPP
jgi:hypothetical protein